MTPEQFDQLLKLLGNIGTLAYQAALQQVYADNLVSISLSVFIVVVVWGGCRWAEKLILPTFPDDDRDNRIATRVVFSVIGWGVTFAFLINIATNLVRLLAPQYAALQYLAGLVKNVK